MWDPSCSDGSVRVGLALGDNYDTNSALGDDQSSIAWWDRIIDGAVYKEISTDLRMNQGAHLGLLLDFDARKLEFYVDKSLVHEIADFTFNACTPAFYTRTHADRLSIVDNPTPPLA